MTEPDLGDLLGQAILGARAEAAATAQETGEADDAEIILQADEQDSEGGTSDPPNLIMLEQLRDQFSEGEIALEEYSGPVNEMLRKTNVALKNFAKLRAQNEDQRDILYETRESFEELRDGLLGMIAFAKANDEEQLDIAMEMVRRSLLSIKGLRPLARAKFPRR